MIGLLLALVPAAPDWHTEARPTEDWHTNLEEATRVAAQDERPLLVVFR